MLTLLLTSALAPSGPVVPSKIVAASLFKNGYAVVTREINIPASGKAFLEDIPRGVLGTVWITTTDGLKLDSVKNVEIQTKSDEPVANFIELLTANIGKDVKLQLTDKTDLSGKIISANTDMVLLNGADGITSILANQIRSVTVSGGTTKSPKSDSHRALELKVEGNRAGKVYLIGLEKGLTWSPSYAIDLSDSKRLRLTAKAEILNDLADLKGAEVRLVTGFPYIQNLDQIDPILANESIENYLQMVGRTDAEADAKRQNMGLSNSMAAQAAPMGGFGGGNFTDTFNHPDQVQGSQEGDLFFYKQGNVTLNQGERNYRVLADAPLDYKEVYTWDGVSSFTNEPRYGNQQPVQPPSEIVWHSIEFTNGVGEPLTTGPVTFFKNGELVGQDLLRYTSSKADTLVKINQAIDVRGESVDEETARKRSALQVPGVGSLDLVTVKTTLKLTNHKSDTIHVRITRPFTGDLVETGDGKVTKNARGLRSLNASGKLTWERDLESGKTFSLSFTTQIYVRTGNFSD